MNFMKTLSKALGCTVLIGAPFVSGADTVKLYFVEDSVELAQIFDQQPIADYGTGRLRLVVPECDTCKTSIVYNANTRLTTPMGSNRPITELSEWNGAWGSVYYAISDEIATRIVIVSATEPKE